MSMDPITQASAVHLDALIAHVSSLRVSQSSQPPSSSSSTPHGHAHSHVHAHARTDWDWAWTPEVPAGHTSFSWDASAVDVKQSQPPAGSPAVATASKLHAAPPAAAAAASDKPSKPRAAAPPAPAAAAGKPKDKAKGGAAAKKVADPNQPSITRLDIRVGKVVKVEKHPDADSMFMEEIDLGEEKARVICSNLIGHVTQEELQDARVLVIANLKPAKLRGIMSCGMLLAASTPGKAKVVLVKPPADSKVGERVSVAGMEAAFAQYAADEQVDAKKTPNAWSDNQALLRTNDSGVACFNGQPLMTSAGQCVATLSDAAIS